MRQVLARLLGNERLQSLTRGSGAAMLVAGVVAAGLGPAAALALAQGSAGSGGNGLGGAASDTTGYRTTTSTVLNGTTTGTVVSVTTPCSGSLGTSATTTGPAVTTTVPGVSTVTTTTPATATVITTATTATTETETETGTTGTTTTLTIAVPLTTTATTTVPTTTTATATVPTTTTETTPGTTTVTTTPACPTTAPAPSTISVPKTNPFNGRAMWIWEMHYSDGGNVAAIIAQAKRYGIKSVYIKSSDGTGWWPQFSRELVTELHEAGLRVCAWQYVYGRQPLVEANLGSRAAHDGADCLVIDAESQYQSRYIAAQTYIARLRKLIGNRYPVGLAGFPYVDYHLSFPYSVFLGPNGAQYNLPQMYWADIGTSVPFIFAHTYEYNEIYRRPIYPLGQLWGNLSASSIESFNLYAKLYGAAGVSWWDWQSAPLKYFGDITKTGPQLVSYGRVNKTPASVFRGNKGDLVIWAQEHLYGAGFHITIDGQFGPRTQSAVRAFQRRHRLSANGIINGLTWDALDKVTPVKVRWTQRGKRAVAVIARDGATTVVEAEPAWMRHARSRNELHSDVGEGGTKSGGRPSARR